MAKESITGLLQNLESFEYNDTHPARRCGWPFCGLDFKRVVDKAIGETERLFDGLCLGELLPASRTTVAFLTLMTYLLDCMHGTSATNADKERWNHNDRSKVWSEGCRIEHGEPTYFYSVMRRRENRAANFV